MPRKLYHLAVYQIDNQLIYSASKVSLRESIRLAGLYVADMDNYSKVYRELARVPGAYAAGFRLLPPSPPPQGRPAQKQPPCFVILNSVDLVGPDFTFPPTLGGSSASGSPS